MIQLNELSAGSAPPSAGLHQHLGQLLEKAWKNYRKSFRRCRAKFSEASVHDLRVDSRRLLALLNLLGTLVDQRSIDPLQRLVRKVLRRLARLRDTQVQLLLVERQNGSFPKARPFRNALREREDRLIREAEARMHRARLGKIKAGMAALREEVHRVLADHSYEQCHWEGLLRAVKQASAKVTTLRKGCRADDLKTIHRLRVAFKEFRYMAELLQPVLPGVSRRELAALQALQDRLGAIQDSDVLVRVLDKFSRKRPGEAAAVQEFRRDAERRRRLLVREFLAGAGRIRQLRPPRSRVPERSCPRIEQVSA